ncbi:hypothetical protein ACOMHN_050122 [Nucella lapillus]
MELQSYADQHFTKQIFPGLSAVYGPPSSAIMPIQVTDGTLLTEKTQILEYWTAHFSQLLNKTSTVKDQAIQDIPQGPLIHTLDDPPTREETIKAIGQLQIVKAPGPDGIPSNISK